MTISISTVQNNRRIISLVALVVAVAVSGCDAGPNAGDIQAIRHNYHLFGGGDVTNVSCSKLSEAIFNCSFDFNVPGKGDTRSKVARPACKFEKAGDRWMLVGCSELPPQPKTSQELRAEFVAICATEAATSSVTYCGCTYDAMLKMASNDDELTLLAYVTTRNKKFTEALEKRFGPRLESWIEETRQKLEKPFANEWKCSAADRSTAPPARIVYNGVDLVPKVNHLYNNIRNALDDVKDTTTGQIVLPRLRESAKAFGLLERESTQMPAQVRADLAKMAGYYVVGLRKQIDRAANVGVSDEVRTVLDSILKNFETLSKGA